MAATLPRIGYVGHAYGALNGGILARVEKRVKVYGRQGVVQYAQAGNPALVRAATAANKQGLIGPRKTLLIWHATLVTSYANADDLARFITDEVLIALKQPPHGIARRLLGPLLHLPARRFAALMAEGDRRVALNGLVDGARWLLTQIVAGLEMHGAENVPKEGPVLIAANHPGAYDTVILIAGSGRPDLKMVASDAPFTRALIATAPHLIYISPDDLDAPDRITAIRAGIHHLQDGGALLLYPGSIVDPDPDILSGAEEALKSWSGSLDVFLRHAPHTRVVPAIVGSVLSQRYFHNPLVKIPRTEWEKRKLAEVIQIGHQMISNKPIDLTPRVTFGEASRGEELRDADGCYRPAIIDRARQVLLEHMRRSTTD